MQKTSFSDAKIKGIDYFTEEYVKQLLMEVTNQKVSIMKPFVGSISFPGPLFPSAASQIPTLQFAATTYIGLMQMVFPDEVSELVDLPAFTVLQFNLDGVQRSFLTIAGGDILAGSLKFSDFVKSLYPDANKPVPFNESAIHVLKDFSIYGSKFEIVAGVFQNTGFASAAHTKDYSFCISNSGYSAVID